MRSQEVKLLRKGRSSHEIQYLLCRRVYILILRSFVAYLSRVTVTVEDDRLENSKTGIRDKEKAFCILGQDTMKSPKIDSGYENESKRVDSRENDM